jgi:hypothetical protein
MMKFKSAKNIFHVLQTLFSRSMSLSYVRNLSWAILIGWLSVTRADAFEYEADGMLEEPVSFKVYVRDCQWLIHITQQNAHTKYLEIGFDGKTMYYSSMLDEKVIANINPKPPLWTGGLSSDAVPFNGSEPNIPIIWLALASSCYLNDAKDHLIPPYSTQLVRARLPAFVFRMSDLPKLPQAITFLDDGFSRKFGAPRQRPPPFDKGFTNAIYTVNSFTNVGSYSLPREFNLKVFLPVSSNIKIFAEYNGIVDNVRPECALTNFIPEIGGMGFVNDQRFLSVDDTHRMPFLYRTNRWLGINEVKILPGFSNYTNYEHLKENDSPTVLIHGNEVPTTATPTTRRIVRCFLYTFIFGSCFVFILYCFRYKNK